MNYETIQSFLNTPVKDFFRDEVAIEHAKDTLKKYECFNSLLKDKEELFKQCEEIILLELLNNLPVYKEADRSFIIGYKFGLRSLLDRLDEYKKAYEYLNKEGE